MYQGGHGQMLIKAASLVTVADAGGEGGTWVVNPQPIGGQRVSAAALQPNVVEITEL